MSIAPFTTPLTREQAALVGRHAPLVRKFVGSRIRQYPHLEHIREDMFQEGMLALCRAVVRFDPQYGRTFGMYAKSTVVTYVREFERRSCNPVQAQGPRGGVRGVYVKRGAMPTEDPGHTPDPSSALDANALYTRAHEALTRLVGARNTAVFFRVSFDEPVGPAPRPRLDRPRLPHRGPSCTVVAQEFGVHRSAIQQIKAKVQKKFDAWAEQIRNEAA